MKRFAIIALVLLVAATCASADYISFFGQTDIGGGYWRYDYRYHNPEPSLGDLTAGVTTWTLGPIVGLDDPSASSGGAVYWDSGTIADDYKSVSWTYLGDGDPGLEIYGVFQVTVYHPSGHTDDVPFEINEPDEFGDVPGPTPEPATLSLCLLGLGALAARKRYSR